jgi:hypothetical protein
MGKTLFLILAAFVGLISGFVSSLLSPLINCFCCGPAGGLIVGAAASLILPQVSRGEAPRISALGGGAFGVGAWIGLALQVLLGIITGATQQGQQEILRLLGVNVSPEEAAAGLVIGILIVLCVAALGLVAVSAGAGWLGGRLVLAVRGEARS